MLINKRNIILFLTLISFLSFLPCQDLSKKNIPSGIKTVVIDPGHGGNDPGALGKHSKEKDIVLAISLKLRDNIISEYKNEVRVILTRDSDMFVALHKRAELANREKADLFISIHANSNPKVNAYGAETYAMGLHTNLKNLEVAKKENAVITLEKDYKTHYEGFDPNSAESYIIFNLLQNTYLNQSLNFASYVQEEIFKNAKRYNRGVKQAGFLVLWRTSMPSVLVETGFISNEREERYLLSELGQKSIAKSIFNAFKEYKTVIESQSANYTTKSNDKSDNPYLYKPSNNMDSNETKLSSVELSNRVNNIYFKVQITASGKKIPINSDIFKDFENVEEFEVSNIYKYAVGNKNSYHEIIEYSKKVKEKFSDAFIIAIKENKIISVKDALDEIQKK